MNKKTYEILSSKCYPLQKVLNILLVFLIFLSTELLKNYWKTKENRNSTEWRMISMALLCQLVPAPSRTLNLIFVDHFHDDFVASDDFERE